MISLLASLHWLPVKSKIKLKILPLNVLNDQAQSYLQELIEPYFSTRTLRSQGVDLTVVPKISKNRMGARTYGYQAPLLWNHLPVSVWEADTVST